MNDLLNNFEYEVESATLIPSDGGRFEVAVNGQLVYSKLQTHRHAEPGEVVNLVSKIIK
jgi:selenoprotein W-related protein